MLRYFLLVACLSTIALNAWRPGPQRKISPDWGDRGHGTFRQRKLAQFKREEEERQRKEAEEQQKTAEREQNSKDNAENSDKKS